jgi:membrane protease YdiL (CAAX protease family)
VIEAALNGAAIRPPAFDAVFVLTVVLSPIAEETLFRGSLYGLAESHRGPLYATTATALAFAASHGSLDGLFRVLWAGIVYGTVRALTGCVATSACVHSLGNLLARFTSWSDDWRWR